MADQQDPRQEQYNRAREAFDDLKIEDKTVFLLKETVNTIFEGVETCARTIAGEFGSVFGDAPAEEAEAKAEENGAAKSSAKKTTRAKSTRAKSTRAKTGSTKKTTTKRTSSKKSESDDT